YPFFELLAHLKEWKSLGFYLNGLAGAWVASRVGPITAIHEAPKAADFDSFPHGQGIGHGIKNKIHHIFGPFFRHAGLLGNHFDQLGLIHTILQKDRFRSLCGLDLVSLQNYYKNNSFTWRVSIEE